MEMTIHVYRHTWQVPLFSPGREAAARRESIWTEHDIRETDISLNSARQLSFAMESSLMQVRRDQIDGSLDDLKTQLEYS